MGKYALVRRKGKGKFNKRDFGAQERYISTVGLGLTHYKALKNENLILRVVFIS